MAVQAILLLATLLPCAALAAFSPDFHFFLACGANSSVSFPSDNPARTFVSDADYLSPAGAPAVSASSTPASPPVLYAAARADISAFSYRLPYPASPDGSSFLVLRLHFFPFFPANSSQSVANISSSRFAVSVLDAYVLMISFRPPVAGVVKEFRPAGRIGRQLHHHVHPGRWLLRVRQRHRDVPGTAGAAVEQRGDAGGRRSDGRDGHVAGGPVAAAADEDGVSLNVGGPMVTIENDTLWHTWLPDGPYLLYGEHSEVNSTSSPIIYDPSNGYSREVAPDVVYQTQRAANFDLMWMFPVVPGSRYLVRLHFCDYEVVRSVVGVGIVFDVYVAQAIGTPDLSPTARATQSNEAFYMDYATRAPSAGNLTVSIGGSAKRIGGRILKRLEIMRIQPVVDLRSRGSLAAKRIVIITVSAIVGASVLACVVLGFFAVPYTKDGASDWAEQLRNLWSREGSTGGMERVSTKLHISLTKIMAATDNFHERNLIGVGGFGNVYKGVLADGTPVAVKRATHASQQGLPEFFFESIKGRPLSTLFIQNGPKPGRPKGPLHEFFAEAAGPAGISGGDRCAVRHPAPAPGVAHRVLQGAGGDDPGVRVHGERHAAEPPLRLRRAGAVVEAAAGDLHRRGEGPALPAPRIRREHHPPRRQVDQHPPRERRRRRDRSQGGRLRAVARGAVVRGDAREHGGEGELRVPGPGLLQDAAADGPVGCLLLRRGAAGGALRAAGDRPEPGARPGQHRRVGGEDARGRGA